MKKSIKSSYSIELVRRLSSSIASVHIKKRDSWVGKFDFILSCIGYAVGLGTIWRFPYVCYRNGGGAFLIPYVIYMILLGMPLVILEMGFGQFASLSPISIWRISPLFKGVGIGMVIVSGITCVYYNVIIAWTLFYFAHSFSWTLPWKTCQNSWNTPSCVTRYKDDNSTRVDISNITNPRTASEEFWSFKVLNISPGMDEPGYPQWPLVLCLVIAWIFIFLCLYRGVKTSGRVVYVTATLPYVLLFIFIIKGLTMDGAMEGIKFYIVPKWEHLLRFQPWAEAAQQMFYSMGVAWGAWITMASYNKFGNNFYRDAIIVSLVDTLTAFLSGFVVFSTIGYMAKQNDLKIEDVVVKGPGLVFIVLPEAISSMPFAPFWAILFFVFIFFVGVDSQFGMFETVLSGIFDECPVLSRKKYIFTGLLCFIELLVGIACVTRGGIYVFQILDWYCSTFSLMVLSLLECVAIAWVYGNANFYHDMTLMLNYTPTKWWGICWKFITPALILFVLITNVIMHTPVTYGTYVYPTWAILIGILLSLVSILPVPICAVCQLYKVKGTLLERIKESAKPTRDWGPAERSRTSSIRFTGSSKIAAEIIEISSDTANLNNGSTDIAKIP